VNWVPQPDQLQQGLYLRNLNEQRRLPHLLEQIYRKFIASMAQMMHKKVMGTSFQSNSQT
jgi:hypothetical protein